MTKRAPAGLRFFGFLVVVLVSAIAGNACSSPQNADKKAEELYANILPETQTGFTLSGNYLAARFAQRRQDWMSAQDFMSAVVDFDHDNEALQQRAFLLSLGAGRYDRALGLAKNILPRARGNELANIFLSCDAFTRNDFPGAIALIDRLPKEGFGQYTRPLLTAWALAGQGKADDALALLGKHADAEDQTYNIHAALIEELAGRDDRAAKHYRQAVENGLTLQAAVLSAGFFQRIGEKETAKAIYDSLGKAYPFNPFVIALKNEKPGKNIRTAADGAAIALLDLASLLYERRAYDSAQIYGSMVQMLSPDMPFGLMMMGDISALNEQYLQAAQFYNRIHASSPMHWLSRMRLAEIYEADNRKDDAIDLLKQLSEKKETRLPALITLGDMHRRDGNFDKALEAYDTALDGVDKVTEDYWSVVYARGMALERLDQWPRAEKDLLQALSLQPENPLILNFIGYSWAEKGVHLDKALEYTGKAAALRPNDGYIVDSYGWALYQSGKYNEALEQLEKAVSLVPNEPTVLEHLGDAYWRMGRSTEAKYKWRHALENSKEAIAKDALAEKIKTGLSNPPKVAQKELGM